MSHLNIDKKFEVDDYATYAEQLMDDDGNFFSDYLDWVSENEQELKALYATALFNNDDDVMEYTFIEWSLEKWAVDNYNKLREEIEQLTEDNR